MKHSHILKLVYSSLFATLVFVGTQFIKIPLLFGYFNLGDPFVLLSGYFIGGAYGIVAAAIGSGLADLLSGYAIYAPATLIIKPTMALIVFAFCYRKQISAQKTHLRFIISTVIAEIFMVVGYYLYESVLYGFSGAIVSVPGNILQGIAAVVISTITVLLFDKTKINMKL